MCGGSGGGGEDAAAAVVPYFPGVARAPVFSAIAQRAPRGTPPAEVTRLNMDPGARLLNALAHFRGDWRALLAELQARLTTFPVTSASSFCHV